MLYVTLIGERYFVEYNGCVVYAAYTKQEALQWAVAHSKCYK